MALRKLIEFVDMKAKEDIGEYYIISKNGLDNIMCSIEATNNRLKEFADIIFAQQEEIARLSAQLLDHEVQEAPNANK